REIEGERARDHGEDVADGRGELRAGDLRDERDQAADARRPPLPRLEGRGERGRGHGGLLRGEGEAEHAHEEEAAGVVRAREEGGPEGGERRGREELERGGEGGEEAAARRGEEHGAPLGAGARDVVLAALARALHDLAREEVRAGPHEREEA